MSKTKYVVGAGAALAFALSATSALAQTGQYEPHIIVAPSEFGGLRPARQGDNDIRGFDLAEYRRYNAAHGIQDPGDARFNQILSENRTACARVGDWVRRSVEIQNEAKRLGVETTQVRNELVELGGSLRRAAVMRTGANVLGTGALCALSGGWYCGAAVLFGLGNEVTGQSHSQQSKLNRRQSLNTANLTILNTQAMVLHTEMNIGWAVMVNDYCLAHHTDATIGMTTSSSVTMSGGAARPAPSYPREERARQQTW